MQMLQHSIFNETYAGFDAEKSVVLTWEYDFFKLGLMQVKLDFRRRQQHTDDTRRSFLLPNYAF